MLQFNSLNANFGFLFTGYHLLALGLLVQSNTVLLLYFSLDCSIRCTGVRSEAVMAAEVNEIAVLVV
jgi:hypothetical protein